MKEPCVSQTEDIYAREDSNLDLGFTVAPDQGNGDTTTRDRDEYHNTTG